MTVTMRTDSAERTADRQTVRDRLDNADFSWFVVASLPHQEKKLASMEEYNSENTKRLTVAEIKEKLLTLPYIREELESFGKK